MQFLRKSESLFHLTNSKPSNQEGSSPQDTAANQGLTPQKLCPKLRRSIAISILFTVVVFVVIIICFSILNVHKTKVAPRLKIIANQKQSTGISPTEKSGGLPDKRKITEHLVTTANVDSDVVSSVTGRVEVDLLDVKEHVNSIYNFSVMRISGIEHNVSDIASRTEVTIRNMAQLALNMTNFQIQMKLLAGLLETLNFTVHGESLLAQRFRENVNLSLRALENKYDENLRNLTEIFNDQMQQQSLRLSNAIQSINENVTRCKDETEAKFQQLSQDFNHLTTSTVRLTEAQTEQCEETISNEIQQLEGNLNSSIVTTVNQEATARQEEKEEIESMIVQLSEEFNERKLQLVSLNRQLTVLIHTGGNYLNQINDLRSQLESKVDVGWIVIPGGFSYLIVLQGMNWDAAKESCQGKGSHLAYAGLRHSTFLYTYIFTNVVKPLGKSVWIGLNDKREEGLWQWIDGKNMLVTEAHWKSGQPNGYHDQDCVELDVDTRGQWGDFSCSGSVTSYPLCERVAKG